MNSRFLRILIVFLSWSLQLRGEPKPFYGPIIESYQIDESTTVRAAIDKIRQAALKGDKSFALNVQLAETHLESTYTGRMTLKKGPAAVALKYLCEYSAIELIFEDGLWTIQPRSGEEGPDIIQILLKNITPDELSALGIRKSTKRFVTEDQKKWPSGEHERATLLDGSLIVRARRSELDNPETLLKLHRAGYRIPKINSRQ